MPRNHRSGDNNALQKKPPARVSRGRNEVRIIGGRWRGRKIRFPAAAGIRPSPDRVRETLFNWLGQDLTGWRVLDAFAGSGALGIEAASRGAAQVTLLETDAALAASLRATCARLGAAAATVERVLRMLFTCSMAIAGGMPSMLSTFGLSMRSKNCRV